MRKKICLCITAFLFFFFTSSAQTDATITGKLKVFIDCSSTWCDMSFIRTEINIVDFMLDRVAADVHVLITSLSTGGGSSKYQLIFFGQNNFKNMQDTLRFNTGQDPTDFERRDILTRYLKLGLAPYVAKTEAAKDVIISFKKEGVDADKKDSASKPIKDPWNYWVYRVGANANLSADAVYKDNRFNGNFSVNRTTEELKVNFSSSVTAYKSKFEFDDNGTTQKIIVNNHNYDISHFLIKSINSHWSWGYEVSYSQNSFSNNKGQVFFRTAAEYDIFPYKEANTRFFTVSYGPTLRMNRYYDTTIYEKTKETLLGQRADAKLTFNQKWGTIFIGINYQNYFHNWKLFNLGMDASTNIRITGGLSFNIYFYGALTRDQLYLPKGGATEQEILTRRRQIASGYSIYTGFGLGYRFGSKLNNFVNPRFEGGNN